ncbi:hypothetical protein PENTCL1PPCAC_21764, partial [Pristionchus entomophagus]
LMTAFSTFRISGIVPLIQQQFNVNDAQTATIRTSSSVAHTATLALVWIFGDVFERRKLFLISVAAWISLCLLAIILGSTSFVIFVAFRSLAAAAASVYGVLVPVMLADLFRDRALGVALMCIAASELFSTHFTNILNSWIVTSGVPWQSGLVAGPFLAVVPLLGLACAGKTFRSVERSVQRRGLGRSFTNAFSIFSIKSYVLLSAECSLRMFFTRAFWFWYPTMLFSAWTYSPSTFLGLSYTTFLTTDVPLVRSGLRISGCGLICFLKSWRHGTGPFSIRKGFARAYPIVVCVGASIKTLAYVAALLLLDVNAVTCQVAIFLVGLGGAANLNLSQQMMLMVVPSNSRAAAVALSRLVSGIVASPSAQVVGMVSDAIRGDSTLPYDRFHAYQL